MTEAITFAESRAISGRPNSTETQVAFDNLADEYERNLKKFCPVNKNPYAPTPGALRASLRKARVPSGQGEVTYDFEALDYAKHVIYGTKPHIIEAQEGGVLAFPWALAGSNYGLRGSWGIEAPHLTMTQKRNFRFGALGKVSRGKATDQFHRNRAVEASTGRTRQKGTGRFLSNRTGTSAVMAFFPKVHHPGTKPNNFVERAIEASAAAEERLMATYEGHLDAELESLRLL